MIRSIQTEYNRLKTWTLPTNQKNERWGIDVFRDSTFENQLQNNWWGYGPYGEEVRTTQVATAVVMTKMSKRTRSQTRAICFHSSWMASRRSCSSSRVSFFSMAVETRCSSWHRRWSLALIMSFEVDAMATPNIPIDSFNHEFSVFQIVHKLIRNHSFDHPKSFQFISWSDNDNVDIFQFIDSFDRYWHFSSFILNNQQLDRGKLNSVPN